MRSGSCWSRDAPRGARRFKSSQYRWTSIHAGVVQALLGQLGLSSLAVGLSSSHVACSQLATWASTPLPLDRHCRTAAAIARAAATPAPSPARPAQPRRSPASAAPISPPALPARHRPRQDRLARQVPAQVLGQRRAEPYRFAAAPSPGTSGRSSPGPAAPWH